MHGLSASARFTSADNPQLNMMFFACPQINQTSTLTSSSNVIRHLVLIDSSCTVATSKHVPCPADVESYRALLLHLARRPSSQVGNDWQEAPRGLGVGEGEGIFSIFY